MFTLQIIYPRIFVLCIIVCGHHAQNITNATNTTNDITDTTTDITDTTTDITDITTDITDTTNLTPPSEAASTSITTKINLINPPRTSSTAFSVAVGAYSSTASDHTRNGTEKSTQPEWLQWLMRSVTRVDGSSSPNHTLYDTVPALILPVLEKLQEIGTYASMLNGSISSQCVKDLKYFEDGLKNMDMWALDMVDAMGKLKPGIMKGQATLVGDYDQCRMVSHEISPNHTIIGQFCRLGLMLNESRMGIGPDKTGIFNSFLSHIVAHTCVPSTCNQTDVFNLFRGIYDTIGAVLVRQNTDCVHVKDPTHDSAFWTAIGVFAFLAFLCLLGTVVEQVTVFLQRKKDSELKSKDTLTNGVKAEKGIVLKGYVYVNPAFDREIEENPKALSQEISSVAEAQKSLSLSEEMAPLPQTYGAVNAENTEVASQNEKDCHNGNNGSTNTYDATFSDKTIEVNLADTGAIKESMCTKLIICFSVMKNGQSILRFGMAAGDLGCVHGMRAISRTWQVLSHSFVMHGETQGNKKDRYRMMSDWTLMPMTSGTIAMDTFFFLSGLLAAYLFLRQVEKAGGLTVRAMVLYYLHRLWRVTPPYMLVLAYECCIAYYTWLGPFDQAKPPSQNCKTYWWYNLLYIDNFFPADKLCVEFSWYLSNDMQFYIIAPIALIPWIFRRKTIGCLMALSLVAVHMVTTAYFVYRDDSNYWFNNKSEYFANVYVKPWCRVAPFAIGLLAGYALYRTHCQYKMQKLSVVVGWTLAFAAGLAVIYLPYDNYKDVAVTSLTSWGRSQNAAYEALSRPLWSASLAWVVWACSTGHGGYVNTLLSWKAWIPLSRLSFMLFLLHITVFYTFAKNSTDTFYVNDFTATEMSVCVTVITFMVSFVLSILIEVPTLELEKVLLNS